MTNRYITRTKIAAALFGIMASVPATAPAQAEGYIANYEAYIISVEPWDALSMRKWPAAYSQKIGHIPHDGQYVWVQRCIVKPHGSNSDWCKVAYGGKWGWVNKRFLSAHYATIQ